MHFYASQQACFIRIFYDFGKRIHHFSIRINAVLRNIFERFVFFTTQIFKNLKNHSINSPSRKASRFFKSKNPFFTIFSTKMRAKAFLFSESLCSSYYYAQNVSNYFFITRAPAFLISHAKKATLRRFLISHGKKRRLRQFLRSKTHCLACFHHCFAGLAAVFLVFRAFW